MNEFMFRTEALKHERDKHTGSPLLVREPSLFRLLLLILFLVGAYLALCSLI